MRRDRERGGEIDREGQREVGEKGRRGGGVEQTQVTKRRQQRPEEVTVIEIIVGKRCVC